VPVTGADAQKALQHVASHKQLRRRPDSDQDLKHGQDHELATPRRPAKAEGCDHQARQITQGPSLHAITSTHLRI
jgi:hypothetical protein